MGFSLLIREGPGAGQTYRFEQPEIIVGRVSDNNVVLNDPDVSRKHFSIVFEDNRYVIKDLGSSNGTLLNGRTIDAYPLSSGDMITAGQAVIEFQSEAERNLPARRPRVRGGDVAPVEQNLPARRSGSDTESAPRMDLAIRKSGSGKSAVPSARERFRIKKMASTPTGRFRLWYGGLEKHVQIMFQVGVSLVLLISIFALYKIIHGEEEFVIVRDYSNQAFDFEPRMNSMVFGYGVNDLTHQARSGLTFRFPYRDGRVTLSFDAGFIESENEVEIKLNDFRLIGYAPLAIGTWIHEHQIVLPYDALIQNSINSITFDQIRNPGARPPATWGIKNLRIRETPLPSPDPHLAEERFALGERRWRNRTIGPRNLYDACQNYMEARDYLERLDNKPALYDEVAARIRECTTELDSIFRRMDFEVRRFERFRDWDRAKATLQQMLEFFPDETDIRHMFIQARLRDYR